MQSCLVFLVFMHYLLQQGTYATTDTDVIVLEDFSKPLHTWKEMNDPVMGGRSTGTFTIQDHVGVFIGEVVDVPFLHAPGFIQARIVPTDKGIFPDVSACQSLQLTVRTDHPEYNGYRVSFGNAHAPGGKWHAYGYKANLQNVQVDYTNITIPFTDFTDFWDDATGDPIHTCKENTLYCPDVNTLKNMKTMAVWGEGVEGPVSLIIKSIQAVGCYEGETKDEYSTNNNRHFLRSFTGQVSFVTLFLDLIWKR